MFAGLHSEFSCGTFPAKNKVLKPFCPVSTRRRFDADITLFERQRRCYNVETTLKQRCVLKI